MKRLTLPIIAMIAIIATAPAQSTQTLVSFRDGTVTQTVATPKLTLHDVLGHKGLDLDAWAFGGFEYKPGQPLTGGLALSHRFGLSREVFGDLGLYVRGREGGRLDGGLFFGVGFKI